GVTMQLPTHDVLNRTKVQLEARLCVAMAGRIAEMLHTNQLSTGARNDIEQATEIARAMDAGTFDLKAAVEHLERTALALALERAGGSPTHAARSLGTVGRGRSSDPGGTVRAMMRRLGVEGP
ncbi:hypothetical protein L6V77_35820, partial [Myxococcota bacterium]|nr:hypothetical protein [Myxococcota bacterium]